jgi:23S rRNA U2552 (ribose-2'-O)-methylase RlmE/FtsJ
MNDLENFFWNNSDRYLVKWSNYFKYYDRYFNKFRNKDVRILEIGVYKGGSLQMWKNYFGKDSLIVGMDIDSQCLNYVEDKVDIFIGNQADVNDLGELVSKYKKFDIIIDDGSHKTDHQISTFEYLYDYVNDGGVYLVEDTHTSYWSDWITSDITFVDYAKKMVDDLTMYHVNDGKLLTKYTQSLSGIYFHDSMIFFEKSDELVGKPCGVFSEKMRYMNR